MFWVTVFLFAAVVHSVIILTAIVRPDNQYRSLEDVAICLSVGHSGSAGRVCCSSLGAFLRGTATTVGGSTPKGGERELGQLAIAYIIYRPVLKFLGTAIVPLAPLTLLVILGKQLNLFVHEVTYGVVNTLVIIYFSLWMMYLFLKMWSSIPIILRVYHERYAKKALIWMVFDLVP